MASRMTGDMLWVSKSTLLRADAPLNINVYKFYFPERLSTSFRSIYTLFGHLDIVLALTLRFA